jgi:hypothetical protein
MQLRVKALLQTYLTLLVDIAQLKKRHEKVRERLYVQIAYEIMHADNVVVII